MEPLMYGVPRDWGEDDGEVCHNINNMHCIAQRQLVRREEMVLRVQ